MKDKTKNFVWISFDLGVQGDYESLYRWLDAHDAKECGESLAGLWYEHRGNLLENLKQELGETLEVNGKTRIYVIRKESGKMKGRFIFGRRSRPPWSGLALKQDEGEDEDYGT